MTAAAQDDLAWTEKLPIGAYQPLLDEARRVATPDGIQVLDGPAGGYGFRRGWWTVARAGKRALVFASVPHCLELAEQNERVAESAALGFAIRDLRTAGFPEGHSAA